MSAIALAPGARQGACRAPRPKHASERRGLCHSHVSSSRQFRPTDYVARVGGSTFLEVDPIEGGLDTNDYAYVKDPVNEFDLDGNGICLAGHNPKKGKKHGGCRGARQARAGARIGIGLAAGAAAGALAGGFCAATAGAGCFIAAGIAGRMIVGTAGQLLFDRATGTRISAGSALATAGFNIVGGGGSFSEVPPAEVVSSYSAIVSDSLLARQGRVAC